MKKLITLLFMLSLSFAQQRWTRTYGGADDDVGCSIQQTSDGGYIISGFTYSFGAGHMDVYLIKTDAYGDTLWVQTYGGTGSEGGGCVQQTSDGGYIIVGDTYSFGAGQDDVYLIKTDSIGDTLWTRTFGGEHWDNGQSVQQTSDGGYIVVGTTYSFGVFSSAIYLIKMNASGDTLWTRIYGGNGGEEGYDVRQTTDEGYIIIGRTSSGIGSSDIYLIKTNASGDTLWTRIYSGREYDAGLSVKQTFDGGYIATGFVGMNPSNGDIYLFKTDYSGDLEWDMIYGGPYYDDGYAVTQTQDSGYIVVGSTDTIGNLDNDVWLLKTNAVGDTLWTKIYGGAGDDVGEDIRQTSDGGYIITGYTASIGAGARDVYIIKTDANGNAVEERNMRTKNLEIILKAMPNPFTSFARIPGYEKEDFNLSDVSGRMVGRYRGSKIGENLPAGVYFIIPQDGCFKPLRVVKVR